MSDTPDLKNLKDATSEVLQRTVPDRLDDAQQNDSRLAESVSEATDDSEECRDQLSPFAGNITAILRSAEREISSFYQAVLRTYGATQAREAAEDWLESMDHAAAPPDDTIRYWRQVTIAAADRLATRICNVAEA
jgi:hypothetical protein